MHLNPFKLLLLSSPFTTSVLACKPPSSTRITELLAPLSTGDATSLVALFSPNITWTTFGSVLNGTRNYTGLIESFTKVVGAVNGTYTMDVVSVIAEGNYSSTEMKMAEGTVGKNGVPYNQHYVWMMEWDGEMIVSGREYLDTQLVDRLFEVDY
ncbi:hypothetical protein AAF712_004712 [Marasmius tenuissimus]|uniref:SnoaL-like domain-containing protein n=1 Tax=Marasmius tenuissimus TaxID=585030 RepID=A0ABR3A2X9_9AGAR|nr:hypothetical protein PM082_021486 [Marasmius tenuissimus]